MKINEGIIIILCIHATFLFNYTQCQKQTYNNSNKCDIGYFYDNKINACVGCSIYHSECIECHEKGCKICRNYNIYEPGTYRKCYVYVEFWILIVVILTTLIIAGVVSFMIFRYCKKVDNTAVIIPNLNNQNNMVIMNNINNMNNMQNNHVDFKNNDFDNYNNNFNNNVNTNHYNNPYGNNKAIMENNLNNNQNINFNNYNNEYQINNKTFNDEPFKYNDENSNLEMNDKEISIDIPGNSIKNDQTNFEKKYD